MGKLKRQRLEEHFYKAYKGEGVLPGDINGLAKKLQLLAGNTGSSLQVTPQSGTNWFMCWTHCLN